MSGTVPSSPWRRQCNAELLRHRSHLVLARLGTTAFKEVAVNKATAIANNDTVFLSWVYDDKIADCLGFAVYRTDSVGQSTPLPAWVGFQGGSNPAWMHKDTTIWPVQKFNWGDFTAKRGGVYTYDIVPMIGTPNNLRADTSKRLTTDHVTLTPARGSFSVYFTNGILATQALTHIIPQGGGGGPNPTILQKPYRSAW